MKAGIVTINDDNNYGNKLQNYAVQIFLENNNIDVKTIKNMPNINNKEKSKLKYYKKRLRNHLHKIKMGLKNINKPNKRKKKFLEFNKENIKFTKLVFNINNKNIVKKYDYFIAGSDQVWNPTFGRLSDFDLLNFAKPEQRIAFSASFGISKLPENCKEKAKKELQKYKAISVREDTGKKIVEELTKREDVQVLVDPTMLLTSEEWDKVAKKPEQLKDNKKYILNYFLGELSDKRKKEIQEVAEKNDCEIINILDENSPFYQTGPSEFLYLEKNAFLICTDSFHSCVFATLFNKPFIVFDREDAMEKMNSRLETLLKKFKLEDRWYNNKIEEEQLKIDYTEAYKILESEREKAKIFINNAIS